MRLNGLAMSPAQFAMVIRRLLLLGVPKDPRRCVCLLEPK